MKQCALLLALALCLTACGRAPLFQPQARPGAEIAARDKSLPPETATPPEEPEEPAGLIRRWHGEFTDHLIPSEDYGPLYIFHTQDARFPEIETALDGLMTGDGTVVMDAVCPVIWEERKPENGGDFPVYFLCFTSTDPPLSDPEARMTAAAADGRWVIEGTYTDHAVVDEDAFLLMDRERNCKVFDTQGTLRNEFSLAAIEHPFHLFRLRDQWRNGVCVAGGKDRPGGGTWPVVRLNAWTGEITLLPEVSQVGWPGEGTLLPARDGESGLWGYLDLAEDQSGGVRWAIPPAYGEAAEFRRGTAKVRISEDTPEAQIDQAGNILLKYRNTKAQGWYGGDFTFGGRTVRWVQERWGGRTLRDAFYDENWNLLGETPEGMEALGVDQGDLLLRLPDGQYRWASQEEPLDLPEDYLGEACSVYPVDGVLMVNRGVDTAVTTYSTAIFSRDGQELIPPGMCIDSIVFDSGESRFLGTPRWGSPENRCCLYDRAGRVLLTFENDWIYKNVLCYPSMVVTTVGRETLVYSMEGEPLLRYTLFEGEE